MKEFFISDCSQQENKIITSSFVVASKQVKAKKNGEPYLALILADRTGQIEAKMWDNVEEFIDAFEQDDFLKVKGLINKYKNRFQLTIHKLRRMEEGDIDFTDYLPKTTKDIGELWRTLTEFVATFQNPHLKSLVELFMADAEIAERYRNAPAAKTLHHAYIGGLLDHVVSLFRSCDLICRNYPQVNRDLLLTGAFLHDIGKIQELTYNRAFSYTTRGQLLGHMIIELEMLQAKLAKLPDFPAGTENSARTFDHQPSRAVRFRIAQAADVSRSAHAALSRRSGFQDGSDARSLRARGGTGRALDRLQRVAGASAARFAEIHAGRESAGGENQC